MFGNINTQFTNLTLGEIYKFQYGKGNNIPVSTGDYPVYGSNGVVGFHTEYNSQDAPIIGHIGAYAGIVNWGSGKHFVTYNGIICNLIRKDVNPILGFYLLIKQNFNKFSVKGGGQPFISYSDLNSPIVNIPPIALQNQFASFVQTVEKSKSQIQQSLEKLETLKKALMQEYFG